MSTPPVLIGVSTALRAAQQKAIVFSSAPATVLITGETGTGKDLFARLIHHLGPRQGKPFIPVNCAALPDTLFENELFGHARGAYTGATIAQSGLLAEAEGGTLFLDEIDTLGSAGQAKVLRFLQDQSYRLLGSARFLVADVRVIASTNADLKELVKSKEFREDLFHRLNILSLDIPPLRERVEDIPVLAQHFLTVYGHQYGRREIRLSQAALGKLIAYVWPGNVRELEGVLQRAILLSSTDVLTSDVLDIPSVPEANPFEARCLKNLRGGVIKQFELTYLKALLEKHQGNITRAARSAGTERRCLQRLLKKYSLDRKTFLQRPSVPF